MEANVPSLVVLSCNLYMPVIDAGLKREARKHLQHRVTHPRGSNRSASGRNNRDRLRNAHRLWSRLTGHDDRTPILIDKFEHQFNRMIAVWIINLKKDNDGLRRRQQLDLHCGTSWSHARHGNRAQNCLRPTHVKQI